MQRRSRPSGPTTHPSSVGAREAGVREPSRKEEAEHRACVGLDERRIAGVVKSSCSFRNSRSHTRIVLSDEPETMRFLSDEIATDRTDLVYPWRGAPNALPVSISHTRIIVSSEPDTMRCPSGEIATDRTSSM